MSAAKWLLEQPGWKETKDQYLEYQRKLITEKGKYIRGDRLTLALDKASEQIIHKVAQEILRGVFDDRARETTGPIKMVYSPLSIVNQIYKGLWRALDSERIKAHNLAEQQTIRSKEEEKAKRRGYSLDR